MSEIERREFAFLLKLVFKMSEGDKLSCNERQQLINLMEKYHTFDLGDDEFRETIERQVMSND